MANLRDMSKKELQDHLKKRYKDQNNKIKENYDRVSATLPYGTKDRIKNLGLSINGYINELILKDLEQRENPQETQTPTAVFDEMFKAIDNELKLSIETKARIYKNITGEDMPDWMRHEQEQIQVVQLEKSPDSVIFDGLEVSLERAKEIQEKLDQQFKAKEEQEKQTPKRDSFADTLERYKRENSEGKLALNVREDI